MRTALSPLLLSSRCLLAAGKPATVWPPSVTFAPIHITASKGVATSDHPKGWSLSDLSTVSTSTSPLVFHLTSNDPYRNLAIEHYILTNSCPNSRILLFYTNRPCVVIGRNQNPWLEADIKRLREGLEPKGDGFLAAGAHAPSIRHSTSPMDLIRRRSGGGTVFHDDGNLNYSVIVPNSKTFKRSTHAEMAVRALKPLSPRYGFSELKVNDRNDIVMKDKGDTLQWLKVSGSAYKITKGRALHHGTLLISSPYLHKISGLLRSRGRGLIQAKGVESVRSPVGNLAWTPDPQARDAVKKVMTNAIAQHFWEMYGDGQGRKESHNEVVLGDEIFDNAERPEIPSLASGLAELQTEAWIYDGTPRFEFAGAVVQGTQVKFEANHGRIVSLTIETPGKRYVMEESALRAISELNGHEGRLISIRDWYSFLRERITESIGNNSDGVDFFIPRRISEELQDIFPAA
ncbi:uncharacterized protein A1O9_07674 [Exophiala aquamarina CBS 119918]|uniref:Putative lipoate-protein ligase A n=1 Tax=Exophiala aquamarina CBS 119918 TaxID=1182545 RepID=A0A072P9Y9_9EURO|nr:uncharacterized protein A1O9_07674 [Exophiala aquamarina CBS 119918]KEF56093.1 hypothetical protein A1O9_07674 [Exophiala aquamarina CBS 119918]